MWNYPIRNFGLDLIRAIAIILVVASHCTFILPNFHVTLTDGIRLLGATGVDLFFVLSGFLIGGLLLRKLSSNEIGFKSLIHFWKRRWLRTLPNYFVVLILNILLLYVFEVPLVENILLYFLLLQNFLTPHPDFFTEAWSLSIEEYAYLLLPLFMYLSMYMFRSINPIKVFIWTTICTILLLFLFKFNFYVNADIMDYKDWSSSFRKVVIYRLDAIYMGFLAVFFISRYSIFKDYNIMFLIIGGVLFVGLHLLIVYNHIMPDNYMFFFSLFYLPLISLSIALVFPLFLSLKGKKGIVKIITYISTRSYAIYLVNYSLVLLTIEKFMKPSFLAMVVYLLITFLVSEILYRTVESPFLRYRDEKVQR